MRRLRWALIPASVAVAIVAEWRLYEPGDAAIAIADGVVGVLLVVCGVVVWDRRPASGTGPLMLLSGAAWFAGTLAGVAVFWHRGPFVHLLLAYPSGRLGRRLATATVIVAYVDAVVVPIARSDVATLALAVLVVVAAVDVFASTSGPARRANAPALIVVLVYSSVLAASAVQRLTETDLDRAVPFAYDAVVAAAAIILSVDLVRGRWSERVVADLVIALGRPGEGGTLRDHLARALGDPSLVLGYWIEEQSRYVDDLGGAVELPVPGTGRSVTEVDEVGRRVAVLVHDATAVGDSRLVGSVATAARLAVANARMQAEARARLVELAASRRRIVESGDEQRRRLARDLAAGAERRLDDVARRLDDACRDASDEEIVALSGLGIELRSARDELRDVAQGIRPPALAAGGLPAALPILVARAPMPVTLLVDVGRLAPAVEAAVYFVCAEALANVAKHARASTVSVTVTQRGGLVAALILDDGIGGVDPRRGTGLRGLADRVGALGGRFAVESAADGGTTVGAEIPDGSR